MGAFKDTILEILSKSGIPEPQSGKFYSQQAWLNAFKTISGTVGPRTLFSIGKTIPENADFPPDIDTIEKALSSIDVAYHMNHRLNGVLLFNAETGQMQEGIGHYVYKQIGDKKAKIICDNPYPCDFDRGIVTAMANNFKPAGSLYVDVKHDDSYGCRNDGRNSCHYIVSW